MTRAPSPRRPEARAPGRPRHPRARPSGPPELLPWLLLSVAVAVVAVGLGIVAYAAFELANPIRGAEPARAGLTARAAALALALVVPIAGMLAAWTCDAIARLPGRRERRPTLRAPLLALAAAAGAGAGWALVFLG